MALGDGFEFEARGKVRTRRAYFFFFYVCLVSGHRVGIVGVCMATEIFEQGMMGQSGSNI